MAPVALTTYFTDDDGIAGVLTDAGVTARIDDNNDGSVAVLTEEPWRTKAKSYATTRVRFYCGKYEAADLATSWLVYEWASIIAARFLCTRGANPCPVEIQKLYDEVLRDLEMVQLGQMSIPDLGQKDSGWPVWSNVRVDSNYDTKKLRVERPISERTAPSYPQTVDMDAEYTWEW